MPRIFFDSSFAVNWINSLKSLQYLNKSIEFLMEPKNSFEVDKLGKSAALKWATSQEINHSHFEVEWGTDGIRFTNIGQVKDAYSNGYENRYDFMHKRPENGLNYYSLKQVDYDGQFEYSEVRSINMVKDGFDQTTLFPNPTSSRLHVESKRLDHSNNKAFIYHVDGSLISEVILDQGVATQSIDVSILIRGSYILKLNSESFRFVKKN